MRVKPINLLEHFEQSRSHLNVDSNPNPQVIAKKSTLKDRYVADWISLGYFHPVDQQSQVKSQHVTTKLKQKHVAKGSSTKKEGSTSKHHITLPRHISATQNNVNHTRAVTLASTSMVTKRGRRFICSFDMDRFLDRSKKLSGCSRRHDHNETQLCLGRRCIRPFDMDRFLARSKKLAGCSKRHD